MIITIATAMASSHNSAEHSRRNVPMGQRRMGECRGRCAAMSGRTRAAMAASHQSRSCITSSAGADAPAARGHRNNRGIDIDIDNRSGET
jgi:hypothetical protein